MIVRNTVNQALSDDPTLAAGILRMHCSFLGLMLCLPVQGEVLELWEIFSRKLIDLVNLQGEDWSSIARMFSFRTGKRCRERWYNHLRPGIKKDPWSEEEDRVLIEAHGELGNKWSTIANHLPGRTENSIKNRWNTNKRKWSNNNSRRRCRTSGSSLLQNYMQSLAQFPAADERENMPNAVQQISHGDQGASSSSINLSNTGFDMGIDWSGEMLSSLMMSENENWEMDSPEMTAFCNSFFV